MSAAYDVSVSTDWATTRARWAADTTATSCTPFQTLAFLDAWYSSFSGQNLSGQIEPLLVDVTRGGELALRFAFALSRGPGRRVLAFADLGVSDFNAPILGPAAPKTAADAQALWQAVGAALPSVDLVDLRKMPLAVLGRANPMTMLGRLAQSPLTGHLLLMADWDTFHAGLERRVRMEFERCWRVFQRTPDAHFLRVRDEAVGLRVMDAMDHQQRQRLGEIGQPFLLDRPVEAAFYRHRLGQRLASGEVLLTALMAGNDVVATLYAFSSGAVPAVVRISNAGGEWSKVSPGRLIVHRTLHHCAAEGMAGLDLSIGDYDYKRRLRPIKTPLLDLVEAGSWRGQPSVLKHRAIATLRRHPELDARMRRLFGKIDPATGRVPEAPKAELKKGEA